MTAQKATVINMWINSDEVVELLDVVLTYEAAVRGLTRGQAAYELILKAAHSEVYPDKVKARLEDALRGRTARAASESLAVPRRGGRVA